MEFLTEKEKWDRDYDKLKKEHDDFIAYYDKHRTCRCNIDICSHLRKIEKVMFNPRYYDLVNRNIISGMRTLNDRFPGCFKSQTR